MKKKLEAFILVFLLSLSTLNATYPKVALVLSGGGAKGFAEIGVVDEIMKLGIPIDFICGTSMGGIIGGYYALGYTSKDIINMINEDSLFEYLITPSNIKKAEPFSLFKDSDGLNLSIGLNSEGIGNVPGLIGDQGILSYLNKTTIKSPGEVNYNDFYIPFKAVAINASTGEEKILDHGFISDTMRATMSLPVIFPPFILKDGTYCMDGGMVNNLPVQVAIDWGADIIISVDVSSDGLKANGDFSTLSGVLIQTINLTTFGNKVESHELSDIVVSPDVSEYMVLDVGSFDEILQKGYESFELKKDEFIKIRDEISKYRTLTVIDENYESYYNKKIDPLVTSIKIVDITNNNTYSFKNIFDEYIGERLDSKTLIKLEEDVKAFAYLNEISTVAYNFQPVDKNNNEGVLEIALRSWENSPSKIDFIALAKLGFSSNPMNLAWFYLAFDIHTQLNQLLAEKMAVDLKLNISENTKLDSKIGYQFFSTDNYELTLFSQFGLSFGSLSPANNKYVTNYIPTFSIGFDIGMGLDYKVSNKLSMEFLSNYKLISLTPTTLPAGIPQISFENPILNILNLAFSVAYLNMQDTIFAFEGKAVNGIFSINNTDGEFGVYTEVEGEHNFQLTEKDSLKVSAGFGMSTFNYQLTSSYFDLGGYTNLPGYYFGSYTREYLLLNLGYQRYVESIIAPIYFQVGVKAYGYDTYNPSANIFQNCGDPMILSPNAKIPFLKEFGIGVYSGIGFSTRVGDIVVGGGLSLNGNFSLVVEFV